MIAMLASSCPVHMVPPLPRSASCCRTNTVGNGPFESDPLSLNPRRHVSAERGDEDTAETSLRPQRLSEFIGQQQARANLSVFIEAARSRQEALDHVLFVGPPGLGKTTLAQIVARELGVNFRATSGPVIAKAGDPAGLLTNLEARDVVFIDEIHRLNPVVEEILYPAMEDFQLDLIIGEGPAARSVKIDLAAFTLIGATTRAGLLTNPLRDRFGIPVRLNFYSESELEEIVNRGARLLGIGMTADGANEIARRARGTPRIAGRLLRRVRDFALVAGATAIDRAAADRALVELELGARARSGAIRVVWRGDAGLSGVTMLKTMEGGCHCRRVRFRVTADLTRVTDCNCSICTKKGFLHLIVPPERFELLSGKDELTTYQFNTGTAQHTF